jgi:hypothetical protein
MSMKKRELQTAEAKQITALKMEFFRLWELRWTRLRSGMLLMGWGFAGVVLASLIRSMLEGLVASEMVEQLEAVLSIMIPTFMWVSIFIAAGGMVLIIGGFVAKFRAENIEIQIIRLDPEERVLTSWPEEIGRGIRASLDERRQADHPSRP